MLRAKNWMMVPRPPTTGRLSAARFLYELEKANVCCAEKTVIGATRRYELAAVAWENAINNRNDVNYKRGVEFWLKQMEIGRQQLDKAETTLNTARESFISATNELRDSEQHSSGDLPLLRILMGAMMLGAPTTLTLRNRTFKKDLCHFYGGCDNTRKYIRCMILDLYFPCEVVIAVHLYRRSHESFAYKVVQLSNIDDSRNGMLMFKPLEHAFDHLQLSLIREDGSDLFKVKLFDEDIRGTPLIETLHDDDRQLVRHAISNGCKFNETLTFGNVDGTTVKFVTPNRPFSRCLNLQARLAYTKALNEGKIDSSYDFNDFWSEGMSLAEKMTRYFNSTDSSFSSTDSSFSEPDDSLNTE